MASAETSSLKVCIKCEIYAVSSGFIYDINPDLAVEVLLW